MYYVVISDGQVLSFEDEDPNNVIENLREDDGIESSQYQLFELPVTDESLEPDVLDALLVLDEKSYGILYIRELLCAAVNLGIKIGKGEVEPFVTMSIKNVD